MCDYLKSVIINVMEIGDQIKLSYILEFSKHDIKNVIKY